MSNSLAIAAATATLRNMLLGQIPLLDSELSDLEVTTQPPDLARKGITKAQLNLFLYHTTINAAWRNLDMPQQVRPGENGAPPLALNLHYLITAFGRGEGDNDAVSHRVLGGAMSTLHDHPVLSRSDISGALPGNDLAQQFEQLKITALPITIDEMSKLWTTFQTQYRVSAAYEVTVVLIDSQTATTSPLPVLKRGEQDQGVTTVAGSLPNLREIRIAGSRTAAQLGEDITLSGDHLSSTETMVRFSSPRIDQPVELAPETGAGTTELPVHLPDKIEDVDALARWAPGFYTIALLVRRSGVPPMASNEVAFALAPMITVSPNAAPPGTIVLTVTSEPRIAPGQQVLLLFGDQQIEPDTINTPADTAQPTTLTFTATGVAGGEYVVRLRVDGVDSIPVSYSGTPPQAGFDAAQSVTVA
jgi:hypothetical protein